MPILADRLASTVLPAGENFFDALAAALFERCGEEVAAGDLSSLLVLVPALPLAAELLTGLRRAAPRPLLLPRCTTLVQWAEAAAAVDAVDVEGLITSPFMNDALPKFARPHRFVEMHPFGTVCR